MTTFTRESLINLAQPHNNWRVSIYLPTHRAASETLNDQVTLKNLLDAASDELATLSIEVRDEKTIVKPHRVHLLSARGRSREELDAKAFVEPALDAAASPDFWFGRQDGLAMFVNDGIFSHYWLPYPTESLVVVSKRHHITPLVPLMTDNLRFFVLALSQNDVRVLEGDRYGVAEVRVKDMPPNLERALWMEQPEKQRQMHPAGIGSTGTPIGIRHGHREDERERTHRFLQSVERSLHSLFHDETAPLILSGVGYLLPMYREVNTYVHLHAKEVVGNPDKQTDEQLHAAAWQIMADELSKVKQQAVAQSGDAKGAKRASDKLGKVLQAAHEGRIATLLVNVAVHRWGSYDAASNQMVSRSYRKPGDADLIDLAVVQTLSHDGTVYALPAMQMPTASSVAAVFRY